MRIALAQLDLLIGDIDGAMAAIRAAVDAAAKQGADLVVCPELAAFGGYPPRDLVERRWLVDRQWAALRALAETLTVPTIVGCIEPLAGTTRPSLANALAVLDRGVVMTYHKRLLPTYDVFDERRWFRPGQSAAVVEIRGRRIGLTVCEDIWPSADSGVDYGVDPIGELIGRCDLIVNASASPFHVAKPAQRRRMLADVARRAGCPLVYCNLVGAQDELLFDGDSCIVAADGALCARLPRWTPALSVADLADRVDEVALDDIDDLWTALVAGIRGYCAKTRQRAVVLGLSGGIDSALVATLAVDALGAANVTGLLMPGPYSSPGSITDAEALAANLGIARHTLAIGDGFDAALRTLQPVFAGTPSGLAEENLQSRLRGVLVMAVANKLGAMALTTGNKSEIACGYCTIYGDMNGGLAPIGDVYKTDVWRLSRHANRERARIPEASITKAPSAELRENQTDQDSLPPYHVLDRILRRYVEESASPADIVAGGEDAEVVARITRLVEVSEFKRRQAAPALRISRKAFGIGRRMPIARALG